MYSLMRVADRDLFGITRRIGLLCAVAVSVPALLGCPRQSGQLMPSFQAEVTSGRAGSTIGFTNTSQVGGSKSGATNAESKKGTETKAPQRTAPRAEVPLDISFSAAFSLDAQGTIAAGAAITATNTSVGADTSEWRVTGPTGEIFPGNKGGAQVRNLPPVVLPQAGTYTVALTVRNNAANLSDTTSMNVVAATGGNLTNEVATYTWDFGDGSAPEVIGITEDVEHTYATPGTYTVTLTMRQGDNEAMAVEENLIRIFDAPESMEFEAVQGTATGPSSFSFADLTEASRQDPIVMWMWDFGDGTTMTTTTPNVDHVYNTPGLYTVTLTVVTQNGGQSTATRSDVVQVLSVEDDPTVSALSIADYFPLAVGNRWVYRSTGLVSFLPFHFAMSVVGETDVTALDGSSVRVYTIAIEDSLDRNFEPLDDRDPLSGGFLLARVRGGLYAFRDEASLNFFLMEGEFEPFFAFPIANGNIEPRTTTIVNPENDETALSVRYRSGSLFGFLPELLSEGEYRAIIEGAAGGAKSGGQDLTQPDTNTVLKGTPAAAKGAAGFAKHGETQHGEAKQGGGVSEALFGVGDQVNSIAMEVGGEIPYVFSQGLGISYLVGSALTDFFPVATLGPGSEFFAIDSTFALTWARVGGEVFGTDDHNGVSDPFVIFDQSADGSQDLDVFPTVLIPNFGAIPGHLSGEDVDAFYLRTGSTQGGVDFTLDVLAADGAPLTVELREIDANYTVLLQTPLDPASFAQSFDFSEFIATVSNPAGTGEVEYSVALSVAGGGDDHSDDENGATAIGIDETLQGNLEIPGDRDAFAFQAAAGTTYTIETSNASFAETDTILSLLEADGRDTGLSDDDGGFGLFSQLEFTPTVSGTYIAVVSGFGDTVVGPYTITVLLGEATDASVDDHGDVIAEATPITVNAPEATRGNLEEIGDVDDFTFNAVAGQAYVVETSSNSNTDTFIFVFDEDHLNETGLPLFFFNDDGGEGFTSRVVFIATETEPLFVEVQGFQNQTVGRYLLRVDTIDIEDDFGNTAADAAPIAVGVDVNGSLDVAGDVDAFTLNAVAGTSYIIATSGDPNNATDTVLRVFDAGGTLLAENDDAGATLFSTVMVQPTLSGPLTILVSGFRDSAAGAYTLRVVQDDHGNDFETATLISVDNDPINGAIEAFGDYDWFQFDVINGEVYSIETGPQGSTPTDTILFLLDIDGNTLLSNDDGNDNAPFSRVVWTSDRDETLFAVVAGFNDVVVGPYSLFVSSGAALLDDHGSTIDDASPITINSIGLFGEIENGADVDVFAFNAVAGNHYSIDTYGTTYDTYLEVLDGTGGLLAANDDAFGTLAYIFFTAPANETYYVVVAGPIDGTTGEYNVAVRDDDHADGTENTTPIMADGPVLTGDLDMVAVDVFPDFDVFALQIVSGTVYRVQTFTPSGPAVETDTVLAVFDDAFSEIAFNDDRADCTACTSELFFEANYTGLAFVRVEPYFNSDSGFVAHGPYELSVTTETSLPAKSEGTAKPGRRAEK